MEDVLSLIKNTNCNLYKFSLVCSINMLETRLKKDIDDGVRENDIMEQALLRLPNYLQMNTEKIDVSDITPEQAANKIYSYIYSIE